MKSKITFALLLTTLAISCNKDPFNPDSVSYFIFGSYHCKCNHTLSSCASLYKYTPASLVAGDGAFCRVEEFTYEGPSLPAEEIALGAALINEIPDELYLSEETRFGCPDCSDQGGYYVSIKEEGMPAKTWHIDTQTHSLPAFLLPFQQKIRETVDVLQ